MVSGQFSQSHMNITTPVHSTHMVVFNAASHEFCNFSYVVSPDLVN